jgi:hypothetical protein
LSNVPKRHYYLWCKFSFGEANFGEENFGEVKFGEVNFGEIDFGGKLDVWGSCK